MAGDGETSNGRGWMYSGWKDEWYENTKEFLDFAFSDQANVVQNGKIKCPCANCRNYGDDNPIEYFGIIEDILKISWEGSMELELVLFKCRWFDPTANGVRRTPNLGLVEVKHSTRLTNFDPFVLASQVTQVYYLPYACQSPALSPWWLVYHVPPRDRLLPVDNTEMLSEDLPTFQEDVLGGIFGVEIGNELDNLDPTGVDEITDPKELEVLSKKRKTPSSNEEEELGEEEEEVEEVEEEEEVEDKWC